MYTLQLRDLYARTLNFKPIQIAPLRRNRARSLSNCGRGSLRSESGLARLEVSYVEILKWVYKDEGFLITTIPRFRSSSS